MFAQMASKEDAATEMLKVEIKTRAELVLSI